ncbi:hypothetical protein [Methylobacterium sp. Leaf106]|uniref:hypothetical protein n=1 Tax=Methylobacterium sp. Leaf106 TaxID=1736255 RepID=UPI0006F1F395|nr:hypothetical protein [Methylobacterium sp. Leaf106]KQP39580.1 hypothetical protein ASF34_14805 [Methylobacterium sp. Leaf106]
MSSASWPITLRVALAGIIGLVGSVLVIQMLLWPALPDGAATETMALALSRGLGRTMALMVAGLLFAGPLILIAIFAGAIFRPSIERHLLPWSLGSPVAVWLFACLVLVLMTESASRPQGFLHRLAAAMGSAENLLFLLGPLVSGLAFYGLSVPRKQTPPV